RASCFSNVEGAFRFFSQKLWERLGPSLVAVTNVVSSCRQRRYSASLACQLMRLFRSGCVGRLCSLLTAVSQARCARYSREYRAGCCFRAALASWVLKSFNQCCWSVVRAMVLAGLSGALLTCFS